MNKHKSNNCSIQAVLAVMLMLPFTLCAQESDFGNWLIYIGNKQLNNKWNIHNEVQYRNYNAIGDLEQLLIRTGLGRNLTENNNNILLGYGFVLSENYSDASDEKQTVQEHRIYEQFTTKQSLGSLVLSHRYRFEQRFIASDFKMRLRYYLGVNIPFNKKLYASGYNEIFINTKSEIFDRNRIYCGLGYKLTANLKFELGYMSQLFQNKSRDQLNIIAFYNF